MAALIPVVVWLVLATSVVLAQDSAGQCLKEKGSLNEGCIAIRAPWKSTFSYLCPENSGEMYKMTICESPGPATEYKTGTLIIKTAWDCYDTMSYPDPCMTTQCNPPPYNRTECKEIKPIASNTFGGGYRPCCSEFTCGTGDNTYYDQGSTAIPYTANENQLNSDDHPMNPDGTNCVSFMDRYNSNNQAYMCKADEKPGRCPTPNEVDPNFNVYELRACVGDYSCPGDEKCCKSCYGGSNYGEGYCIDGVYSN